MRPADRRGIDLDTGMTDVRVDDMVGKTGATVSCVKLVSLRNMSFDPHFDFISLIFLLTF